MINRRIQSNILQRLSFMPAVALLGPRQVGKTTLARAVAASWPNHYLDLENPRDRIKLDDSVEYLSRHEDELVIIDEVQRIPDLFMALRGLIDEGRRKGKNAARFLLLGSASMDLLLQSESLTGRSSYLELHPFDILEIPDSPRQLWLRGGFPDSFLARNDAESFLQRDGSIRSYLERDIPQFGPRIPAATLHRFWTMLAHGQCTLLNAAQLARNLAVDGKTVVRYLDLMVDLMLVRRLQPYHTNIGKRLVKSPKVLVRDSGIVHALLNIGDYDALMGHPVVGASWEGFVVENLIGAAPRHAIPFFYRTADGAEIDLVFEITGHGVWAIEIKLGHSPTPSRGFHVACDDLKATRRFIVNSGTERYAIAGGVEVIGLHAMAEMLASLT